MPNHVRLVFASAVLGAAATLASAQVATLIAHATADNSFQMSISTDPSLQGDVFLSGNNWFVTFDGKYDFTAPGTYYIQVVAQDFGDPASFIADLTVNNGSLFTSGSDRLVTDLTNWSLFTGGFGVTPVAIMGHGPDGSSPWGDRPNIGNDALNIWADTNPDVVYFTAAVRVIPAPGSLALLGIAGLTSVRRRRA